MGPDPPKDRLLEGWSYMEGRFAAVQAGPLPPALQAQLAGLTLPVSPAGE